MKPLNKRYRHYVIASCAGADVIVDGGISLTFIGDTTQVDILVEDNSMVNEMVYLTGFDDAINGPQEVTKIGGTIIRFTLPFAASNLDNSILGTIKAVAWQEVFPLNFANTKFITEREGVRYRTSLSGKIKFDGAQYRYMVTNVLDMPCCEIKYRVDRFCGGSYQEYWRGYFSHNMGDWDEDKCTVEFSIEKDDAYRCIERNKTKKHNVAVVAYTGQTVVVPFEISYEEVECCGDLYLSYYHPNEIGVPWGDCDNNPRIPSAPFDESGFIRPDNIIASCIDSTANWYLKDWSADIIEYDGASSAGTYHVCCKWTREVATTLDTGATANSPAGEGWIENGATTLAGQPAHNWYRMPFARSISPYNIGYYAEPKFCDGDRRIYTVFPSDFDQYSRFRHMEDIFKYITSNTCAKLVGIRSDFFEINPPGDTPGYVAGTNYVTGDPNKPNRLALCHKSDFINPEASNGATIGEFTFDEWMRVLCETFNCDWFVDDDNYLRIEHISWFSRAVAIDLTTTTDADIIRMNQGKRRYTFDRDNIPVREQYSFMEQANIDFKGADIFYAPPCPNETKTDKHDVPWITTDVAYVQNSPSEIEPKGFVMIVLTLDGDSIDQEAGVLTGAVKNNAHLAWANLHENYHKYNRPLISGNMNGAATNFISAEPSKRQQNMVYIDCCFSINAQTALVRTSLGDGEIDKYEKDNKDEVYRFELLHN